MPSILLASDLHIHTHKNSLKRLQHCLDVLKWIFETAVERGIPNIIFLGDLFQDREKIQVLPYQRTYEVISKYCCGPLPLVDLYILIGNHDMWFANKTDISSIYPLGAMPGVHVIRRPLTTKIAGLDIDFLPFTLNPLKSLEEFTDSYSPILCGHLSLDGAQLNTFYKTQADVSVEYDGDMVKVNSDKFTKWQTVFLGHYHGEQRIGHVEYVGSPLQLNFAEAFQQKHIIVLNTETLEREYIVNDFSPRHLIISEEQLNKFNLNNTFVRLTCKDLGSSDLVDMRDQLMEEHNILSLELTPPKSDEDKDTKSDIADAQDILVQDREEMLVQYMNAVNIPEELEFDKMLMIGKDICQKSQME